MVFAFIILILFLFLIFILKSVKDFKLIGTIGIIVLLLATAAVCKLNPLMHKQFSIDIVEYLIKMNSDGTMTTTKQITRTVVDKNDKKKSETELNERYNREEE